MLHGAVPHCKAAPQRRTLALWIAARSALYSLTLGKSCRGQAERRRVAEAGGRAAGTPWYRLTNPARAPALHALPAHHQLSQDLQRSICISLQAGESSFLGRKVAAMAGQGCQGIPWKTASPGAAGQRFHYIPMLIC